MRQYPDQHDSERLEEGKDIEMMTNGKARSTTRDPRNFFDHALVTFAMVLQQTGPATVKSSRRPSLRLPLMLKMEST